MKIHSPPTTLAWNFPLPRPHTGLPLGKGRFGALIWGEGRTLRITLARADCWDHRGGTPWSRDQNFKALRKHLEANDGA